MELVIKHTNVYTRNVEAMEDDSIRFIINQGGSRSSKTYSICQMLVVYALTNPKTTISIVRKSFPALRGSVMRDLFEIMDNLGIYNEDQHHKGENLYRFSNGTTIEFFSVDDAQKLRGRKRDILYCNEANELTFEDYQQLNMRTTNKLIVDYNPSDNYSWVYGLIDKPNSILIKSTYKDNPFLQEDIIKEIENLVNVDEGYYRVYALGEQAVLKNTIYNHYQVGDYKVGNDIYFGLDIGFNHPMALIEISDVDGVIYARERIYESNMTVPDLLKRFIELQIPKNKEIYVDSARPDVVEDLRRAGYNAKLANKAVKEGIDAVKSLQLVIDRNSHNLIKELRNYKWKTNGDITLDEPVKLWDDACFIGETLITTKRGLVPIKDIKPNEDHVLTSKGYKKVLNKFDNGTKPVTRYSLHSDTDVVYLCSTNNHLIKTDTEWTEISKLQQDQMVFLHKPSMVKRINYGQINDTLQEGNQSLCIQKFGKHLMAKNQKDSTSIIKTITLGITKSKIWNWLKPKDIFQSTLKKGLMKIKNGFQNFIKKELKQQNNGIHHQKVKNGIQNLENFLGKDENIKYLSVNNVEKNMKQDIMESQNFAITTVKLKHLEQGEKWEEKVYDIEVEDVHEYFANGVLVHNCDALRYAMFQYHLKLKKKGSSFGFEFINF